MAITNKTYDTAGTSVLNGVMKVRFANGMAGRIKVLKANEHTDIQLMELSAPKTKVDAVMEIRAGANSEQQAVFDAFIIKNDKALAVELGLVTETTETTEATEATDTASEDSKPAKKRGHKAKTAPTEEVAQTEDA